MTEQAKCVEGKEHCYHSTGVALLSYPPQYPEVCCYCGDKRIRRMVVANDPNTHGAFAPKGTKW